MRICSFEGRGEQSSKLQIFVFLEKIINICKFVILGNFKENKNFRKTCVKIFLWKEIYIRKYNEKQNKFLINCKRQSFKNFQKSKWGR